MRDGVAPNSLPIRQTTLPCAGRQIRLRVIARRFLCEIRIVVGEFSPSGSVRIALLHPIVDGYYAAAHRAS